MSEHRDDGMEYPDPTPVSVRPDLRRPPSLQEEIRRYVRQALSQQVAEQGGESFEEADDFEVDEDPDPLTQYELQPMQVERAIQREAPKEEQTLKKAETPPDPQATLDKAPDGKV